MWHRFKGYAYSQLHKMETKNPEGKRKELIEKYGYDTKFGYHCVRLILEIEQLLVTGDLDMERDRETLKSIRRGEWTAGKIRDFFYEKESALERAYESSTLPWGPREDEIKSLLLECLELHYGDIDGDCVIEDESATEAMTKVAEVVRRWEAR